MSFTKPLARKLSTFDFHSLSKHGKWDNVDPLISGITSDTKKVVSGNIFFAIPGTKVHGANFASEALSNGAVVIITDNVGKEIMERSRLSYSILVTETLNTVLSKAARQFFGSQPKKIVSVTGTNGKTSVSHFVRQIWELLGKKAVSVGTTGVDGAVSLRLLHTTPDIIQLHDLLSYLYQEDIHNVVLESSSHGLKQGRLSGIPILAGGFTNLTRDHLDYHATFDDYFNAKCILFESVIGNQGGAVISIDTPYGRKMCNIATKSQQTVFTVGKTEKADFQILGQNFNEKGQTLNFSFKTSLKLVELELIGAFQAENILIAAGLTILSGEDPEEVFETLRYLKTVPGRMEYIGKTARGGAIFIDYAHTPDAIYSSLSSLKLHANRGLSIVFGAGGERDSGKRVLMGKAAGSIADKIFVTDDNPRNENASQIRKEILCGCPLAVEIPDRAVAIFTAAAQLSSGESLLIAGKGHENTQIIGEDILPFNDAEQASIAISVLKENSI